MAVLFVVGRYYIAPYLIFVVLIIIISKRLIQSCIVRISSNNLILYLAYPGEVAFVVILRLPKGVVFLFRTFF